MAVIDEHWIFADRREAGFELGKIIEAEYKDKHVLVLGIPRGGVAIASEIARILNGELSVIITKKLPHPRQPELAIGASAEDGSVYLNELAGGISKSSIDEILSEQQKEIDSRIQRFRKGKALPDMKNRIVIIADDGIATGATIVTAIKLCKSREASKVVVVAPVAGERSVQRINAMADQVVIGEQPRTFYAVGQVYEDFHNMSDEEVIELLEDFDKGQKQISG
jgi:putative phosphoribosyl transferase